jgi:hypothetical protein
VSVITAKPEHEIAYQDLVALVNKHAGKLSALELLAIASNMVGKLVAMQDQRSVTPAMAMETVAQNIESGNQQVLAQLAQTRGSA